MRQKKERNPSWTRGILEDFQSTVDKPEQKLCEESEERGGNGASKDECVADERDAAENERAEASGADRSGDRSDADGDDRCRANAGKNDGQRKWESNAKKNLRVRQAHGFGSFKGGGV